jgi:NADPH:quinone reductase-like Zn-dependent oxidoreductase
MDIPKEIQRWVTDQDGIKNISQETVALPRPGDGEVLVKINAVSLNYRDTEGIAPQICSLRFEKRRVISDFSYSRLAEN